MTKLKMVRPEEKVRESEVFFALVAPGERKIEYRGPLLHAGWVLSEIRKQLREAEDRVRTALFLRAQEEKARGLVAANTFHFKDGEVSATVELKEILVFAPDRLAKLSELLGPDFKVYFQEKVEYQPRLLEIKKLLASVVEDERVAEARRIMEEAKQVARLLPTVKFSRAKAAGEATHGPEGDVPS